MAWTKECREKYKVGPEYQQEWYKARAEILKKRSRDRYYADPKRHYESAKRWTAKNQEKVKAYQREWHKQRRVICLERLGGQCVCCHEKEPSFLAIDHINNDGRKHRKDIGRKMIYGWLIKNNFPPGFQLLCHNCNMAKAILGACPHKTAVS